MVIFFSTYSIAEEMTVSIDHTVPMKLSRPAASIVVGNPFIADVMAQAENMFFVIGRTLGSTNVVAIDSEGNTIAETVIHVTDTSSRRLSLHRSTRRESYSCAENCVAAPMPGDWIDFFDGVSKGNQEKVSSAGVGRAASE